MTEPIKPGVIIRDLLTKHSITVVAAAAKLSISSNYLCTVLRGTAGSWLTPNMIARLPSLFDGTDEEYWQKVSDDYYDHKKGIEDARD